MLTISRKILVYSNLDVVFCVVLVILSVKTKASEHGNMENKADCKGVLAKIAEINK